MPNENGKSVGVDCNGFCSQSTVTELSDAFDVIKNEKFSVVSGRPACKFGF